MEARRPDLSVDFCGLRLANPLMLASGGLGECAETLAPFLDAGAAAVVTRTVRLRIDSERRVFPSPHLEIGPRGGWMLNCEWGNLRPWQYWQRQGLPELRWRGPVIVSISRQSTRSGLRVSGRLYSSRISRVQRLLTLDARSRHS
jgi:hypothetical protein